MSEWPVYGKSCFCLACKERDSQMKIADVHAACEMHLAKMEKLFQPHCKLTLLMRNPQSDDGDMILTMDDLEKVEAAIRRLRERETVNA